MLNTLTIIGTLLLALAGASGYVLARRGRERLALAAFALAPVLAVAPLAVSSARHAAVEAAPAGTAQAQGPAGAAPAAPAAQALAAQAGSTASVAPSGERAAAAQLRSQGKFAEARAVLSTYTVHNPGDADAWADLADTTAAAAQGDLEKGVPAIEHALAIDPRHPKALWLKASLELQRHHYAAAAALWQRLLEVLPADSNDARVVTSNLREAQALGAGAAK